MTKNSYKLKGKKILITGANGQLGSTYSLALLSNGAFVYLADIQDKIDKVLENRLKSKKLSDYKYLKIDVTRESSIKRAFAKIKDLDVLINNAGIGVFSPFEKRTEKELDSVYEVNLKGTLLCSKVSSELMKLNKHGKIINISSIYGVVPADKKIYGDSGRNSSEIYGAVKAGIIQATRYLAAYLGEYGITVNCISPGGVFNNQKDFFVKSYSRKTVIGRMTNEEDLCGVVCFLSSDDSNYITGQNIVIDGGFTLNQ